MRVAMYAMVLIGAAMSAVAQCDQCGGFDWVSGCSPIVINFEKGPYRLTGADSPVTFDMVGTGQPVRVGWTAAGADVAFLALDRNHNGTIDSGRELFGNITPLSDGTRAANGFMVLAQFDDNRDGTIDERDSIWSQLLLWRDLNHDGISEEYEISPVAGSSLAEIGLDDHWSGRRDRFGNSFRYESRVIIQQAATHATPRPVYDIFFVRVR